MTSHALIVGINSYQAVGITQLRFATADARAMSLVLSDSGATRVPPENLIVLYDADATRAAILSSVETLTERVHDDDTLYFYFAGHGCYEQDKQKGDDDDKLRKYLIPHDCDPFHLASTGVELSYLAEKVRAIRCQRVLMLFDSCYSGAAGGRTFVPPGTRGQAREIGSAFLDRMSGAGRVVITACTGTEVALEEDRFGHGLFTNFLLEGLRGAADYKHDGHVDVDELWLYVQDKTCSESRRRQNPVRSGWVQGPPIYIHQTTDGKVTRDRAAGLETAIVEKFSGLQQVRIADAEDPQSLGATAARYLEDTLRSNSKIAVSCGRSLIEAISQMRRSRLSNIEIFPLNGSPTEEVRLSDSMVLSYLLWSRFEPDKVRTHVVPTGIPPAMLARVEEDISKLANDVLAKAMGADRFMFGIGSPDATNRNILHLLRKAGLTPDDLVDLEAIGEINFHFYDSRGQLLALREDLDDDKRQRIRAYGDKFFALSAHQLNELTLRPGLDLIGVAGGVQKRRAVAGAIRGRLIRTLITDADTAQWLADEAPDVV